MTDDEIRALLDGATPGPWLDGPHGILHAASELSLNRPIGVRALTLSHYSGPRGDDEYSFNARLIAAAPDMAAEVLRLREALRQIANAYDDCTGGPRFVEIAAAALKGAAE